MADLNGKLRSLELYYAQKDGCRNGHPSGTGKICVDCVADELDRQRALGRGEGLQSAMKIVAQSFGREARTAEVIEAIRALKEKV